VLCLVRLLLHLRQRHRLRLRRCLCLLLQQLLQFLQHLCLQPALQYRLARLLCRCLALAHSRNQFRLRHLRQRPQVLLM
jgi:hypothetical protein